MERIIAYICITLLCGTAEAFKISGEISLRFDTKNAIRISQIWGFKIEKALKDAPYKSIPHTYATITSRSLQKYDKTL